MHKYFIKIPWFVKKFFPSYLWSLPPAGKTVYLTFDDGPDPVITPWVLDELKKYEAHATFFCIGKNVEAHPEIYRRILAEGHAVGNHTHTHLNGWKTGDQQYLNDIALASQHIQTELFRPPHGRIKTSQAKKVAQSMGIAEARIIMWDVLSADFDPSFTPQQCFMNVAKNVAPGSIIVFHDSKKAFTNLEFALPATLQFLTEEGYRMEKLS